MLLLSLFFILKLLTSSINTQDITIEDPLPSCKGFIISSPTGTTQFFGHSVDGDGDINDDGIPDIIISEYLPSGFSTVYVIYGTKMGYSDINVATMTSQQGFRIAGLKLWGDDNTNIISISGDIDGDGIKDIVIGAAGTDTNKGAVYVIYGKKGGGYTDFDLSSSSLSSDIGFKITNPNAGAFGWNINTKVDINGDTIKDIIVGANYVDSNNGAVYVIYGQKSREGEVNIATMPLSRGFKISGYSANVFAGAAIGSAGDFNQDYVDDLIITTPGYNTNSGKAYVFYGQNGSFSNSPLLTISPAEALTVTGSSGEALGNVASDAGDFNNDGISDILVSYWYGSYAYLFYGKKGGPSDFPTSSITPSQGFKIQGVPTSDQFGSSLTSIPDINGDGINDLLIGSKGSSSNKGALYVIFGRTDKPSTINLATLGTTEGFKITEAIASGYLGISVRSLGDINQDGAMDLIIGAQGAGKAYVLFGPNAWACGTCGASSACNICKPGYNYKYNGLCYKECPVYAPYQSDFECFKECPLNAPYNVSYQCFPECSGSTPYNLGFQCFSECPTDAPYKSDFECFAKCPQFAPYNVSYQCFTGCSGSTPYNFGFQCFSECPKDAPYKSGFQCFSENPVQPEVVEPISETVKGGVTKGAAATGATNSVLNLWSPANALPFIYGQLKTSIIYMRYLNISRTQKLEELIQLYYDTDTSAVPFISMSSSIKDSFPMQPLPSMFQKYNLPSSFITNVGDDLMGLLVVFALFLTTKITHFLLKKWIRNFAMLKMIINKASITFQNFLIGSFGELVGPIIFYATMEFQNPNTEEKSYYSLSPIVCIFSLLIGLSVMGLCIWTLGKFHTLRKKKDLSEKEIELFEKKYEGISVLFEEFDNSSLAKQSAFLVFSLKAVAESLIVALLSDQPLFQAILLQVLTLLLLTYNLVKRPFQSKISLVQQIVLVLSIFVCNILFFYNGCNRH